MSPTGEILAHNPVCRVDMCSAGHVLLHIGPITLRVEPAALAHIAEAVGSAVGALERRVPVQPALVVLNGGSPAADPEPAL